MDEQNSMVAEEPVTKTDIVTSVDGVRFEFVESEWPIIAKVEGCGGHLTMRRKARDFLIYGHNGDKSDAETCGFFIHEILRTVYEVSQELGFPQNMVSRLMLQYPPIKL